MKLYSILFIALVTSCAQGGASKTEETTQTENAHDPNNREQSKSSDMQLTASQFEKMRRSGVEMHVIDVRTPEETAKGTIPGAVEIDYSAPDFEQKIDGLQKDVPYVVYCEAGGRSSKTAELMRQKGFTIVYNLKDGYEGWAEVGK